MTSLENRSARAPGRREELLDELVAVFLAEGFATFTLDELARRLRCSKSTLYGLAASKEQLVVAVVKRFFRRATTAVEQRAAEPHDHRERITAYLLAVAEQLQPASPAFFADLAAFAPAREIYQRNTSSAAARVQQLVSEGVTAGTVRPVHASFVGVAVASVMSAIHRGEVTATTGLDDAAAYRELADLVVTGIAPR
ncbi:MULTISPECIES: TetR/AcrR family transcriptional regulator [unclassified Modestobacter]|uniref:TetR/AcrR family transcriptional regulator n=1 Tax=unclassified Modestobacter TaxID=2643866 RepID=UPI0022AAA321|nr:MULTISPECIES: TetR/AcrR family transcriptional regulator [unclassified Modestobacter]MCZ2823264.1 TetR/AcrR family transcriptional regulator [Modestobacter sp. VKM Ac-2981]MCZ2851509.1 TetR/AcrR family transcriptional regulator [Modestobacter sp. VKM Ac-2982]